MFFWFGSKIKTKNLEQGFFNCPKCAKQTPFIIKERQRYFTLYSIGLIPLDIIARYAECVFCHSNFRPSVTDGNEFRDNILQSSGNRIRRVLGVACVAVFLILMAYGVGCNIADYHQRHVATTAEVNNKNPAWLILANSSDSAQTMRVLKGVDVEEITLDAGSMRMWESHKVSNVMVRIGEKSVTAILNDPALMTVICINKAGRLRCVTESVEDFRNYEDVKNYIFS